MSRPPPPQWVSLASRDQVVELADDPFAAKTGGPPPLLRGLSRGEVEMVESAGARKVVRRGSRLFSQGTRQDGIFLIQSGRIKVFFVGHSGREITLAYWYPGHFVGGPEVFRDGRHSWSGIAVTDSSVLHLPGDTLRRLVSRIPALALNVIDGLSFKGRCYSVLAQMLGTRSATQRLAHLLLQLVELYGVEEEGGDAIGAPFTHADLAAMIGVTRQWVTTSLKRFAELGLIETRAGEIVVKSAAELRKLGDAKTQLETA